MCPIPIAFTPAPRSAYHFVQLVQRAERENRHTLPPSGKVKNARSLASTPLPVSMALPFTPQTREKLNYNLIISVLT